MRPEGVLHVGAHLGEENTFYKENGYGRIIWVEAQPALIPQLSILAEKHRDLVLHAVAWDESGSLMKLQVANDTQATSVLQFGTVRYQYPHLKINNVITAESVRLEEVIPKNSKFNFVNLDIQGAELKALLGLGDLINQVDYIYTEVNREDLYQDCSKVEELDSWLLSQGLMRVATKWVRQGWGDALYIRAGFVKKLRYFLHVRKTFFLLSKFFESCSASAYKVFTMVNRWASRG